MSNELLHRRRIRLAFPVFLVLWAVIIAAPVTGQDRTVRPRVVLVLGTAPASDTGTAAVEAQDLLETTIEGHLRSSLRYDLVRMRTSDAPETFVEKIGRNEQLPSGVDAVVFARTAPRRDGSLRVELDLWREGRFLWSLESQLPLGRERFRVAVNLADSLESELAGSFPGFGRLSFRNTGVDHPYYVYADQVLIGANLRAIELPQGDWEIEVRRRDDGFEHVVGRRRVTLRDEDFQELTFRLDRDPPPVPGFLRLMDPTERWHALYDLRGAVMIPQAGFEDLEGTGRGVFATALFNDVFFRGHVFGFEVGYITLEAEDTLVGDMVLDLESTSLMASTGISVGPVAKVDYIVRVGGGIAFSRTESSSDFFDDSDEFVEIDYSPAFAGSMEFGFGFLRNSRLSLNISLHGIYENDEIYSFLGLALGLGGRF